MKDQFGREINYLRLSITDLCNLRCRYCMPEEGVCKRSHDSMLTQDEMISAVEAAASLGITKVRITGGEPLVKRNVLSICRRTAAVTGIRELCLTTNGLMLPELAKPLYDAGVSRINLSLDTLDPGKYARITRLGRLEQVLKGLEAALDAGFRRIKINTVLIGGFNDDETVRLASLTKQYPVDVRFIELMPMPATDTYGPEAFIPCGTVLEKLPGAHALGTEGVARMYELPDAQGRIGLISPLSQHFCGSCNRIRLTADGRLKPCLHSAQEISIKGLDTDAMREVMARAIREKPACHGDLSPYSTTGTARNMNQIGG